MCGVIDHVQSQPVIARSKTGNVKCAVTLEFRAEIEAVQQRSYDLSDLGNTQKPVAFGDIDRTLVTDGPVEIFKSGLFCDVLPGA